MNIENIYLSKLNQFRSVIETNASRSAGAERVFQNMLSAVEQRISGGQLDTLSGVGNAAYTNATDTLVLDKSSSNDEIEAAIEYAAKNTGLDANLIRAVIRTESSFQTDAVSGAGAQGLMQLMPGTAGDLGVTDPFDAYQNVNGGSTYLKTQLDRFGDIRLALAAYNTGPARIARMEISDVNNPDEYSKISSGVRGYVDKVMRYYRQYSGASA